MESFKNLIYMLLIAAFSVSANAEDTDEWEDHSDLAATGLPGYFDACRKQSPDEERLEGEILTTLPSNYQSPQQLIKASPEYFAGGKHAMTLGEMKIDDADVQSWLDKAEKIALDRLEIQQLKSNDYSLATFTYSGCPDIFGSWQYTLLKNNRNDYWQVLHVARTSSKSYNFSTLEKFVSTDTVRMEICIDGCDWWGLEERVLLHIPSLSIQRVEPQPKDSLRMD